ncbi:MAG: DUF4180 domain-containing protein [Caldilineaceae bacterium]
MKADTVQVETQQIDGILIGELVANKEPLNSSQDILDLLGSFYPEHVSALILHEADLVPEFFQLRTKLAGEILQKLVNYRVKVAIVGEFQKYQSKALADFIYECNNGRQIFFVPTREEALARLVAAR